jgi:hypothetical protein
MKTPTLFGSLERASDSGYLFRRDPTEYMSPSPYLKMETDPVSETWCFIVTLNSDDVQGFYYMLAGKLVYR